MRTRRFDRLGLALLLVIGCIGFGDRSLIEECTGAAAVRASPSTDAADAIAGRQSIQSQYRASTELYSPKTFNTKHDAFNKHHFK